MPRISVVVPTYNQAQYLGKTIESVLAQRYRDYDLIVVDDGSTDGTRKIVEGFGGRVRYLYQRNRREAAARNAGIRASNGEYVAFLDSDDLWLPNKLEVDFELLTSMPEAKMVYSNVAYIDERGWIIGHRRERSPSGNVLRALVLNNFIVVSSVMVRRECLEEVGGFNEDPELSGSADWELWTRLAADSPIIFSGMGTVQYRIHAEKMMADPYRMKKAMLRAHELMFSNPSLRMKIENLKVKALSNIHVFGAVNFYSVGFGGECRIHLYDALKIWPGQIFHGIWWWTLLRSLLGRALTWRMRTLKRVVSHLWFDR